MVLPVKNFIFMLCSLEAPEHFVQEQLKAKDRVPPWVINHLQADVSPLKGVHWLHLVSHIQPLL